MTVEPVNDVPKGRKTKPEKAEYKEIRDILRDPDNVGRICILAHELLSGDANNMALSIRNTKPKGDFAASVKSFEKDDPRPAGVGPGSAVYAGYRLDDIQLEKLMGKKWMDKHRAKRSQE